MRYLSIDRLTDFEFHDAFLSFISFSDSTLTASAEHLNIHKDAEQNPYPTDMEIAQARLTFYDFCINSFNLESTWKQDTEGKWFISEELCVFTGTQAQQKFLTELKSGITAYSFKTADDVSHCIDAASSNEPWFEIYFTFSSIAIEWDEYRKIAWYEENHRNKN